MDKSFCAGLLATGLAVACGNTSSGGGDAIGACQSYANALDQQCAGGPGGSVDALSEEKSQIVTACADLFHLPGVTLTPSDLTACGNAAAAAGCTANQNDLPACTFTGSLPAGTGCIIGYQCQGGICTMPTPTVGDGGAESVSYCGTCTAAISEGGACESAAPPCAVGTACDMGTCTKIRVVSAGDACDVASVCSGGDCSTDTHTCTLFPNTVGAACTGTCGGSLLCTGSPLTCQEPLSSGAACTYDNECGSGLGCDTSSQKCAPATWASGGQPCGNLVHCLSGECVNGACPVLLADGQPCSDSDHTSTCSIVSICTNGVCVSEVDLSCP